MSMRLGFTLATCVVAFISWVAPLHAQQGAQDYPNRPVRFVIPDGPGGVNDRSARIVAPALSKALGQPVVVDNRPGAAGMIAWEFVAKNAPADGYTIALCNSGIRTLPLFSPATVTLADSAPATRPGRLVIVSCVVVALETFPVALPIKTVLLVGMAENP